MQSSFEGEMPAIRPAEGPPTHLHPRRQGAASSARFFRSLDRGDMMISKTFWKLPLAAVLAGGFGTTAIAQDADDNEYIEEVVVTGTAGGAELRKFDASFAITTTSSEDIEKFSPSFQL